MVPIPHTTERLETVIWDFNGTLVDDLNAAVRSVNAQLERRELPHLTISEFRDVFSFPVEGYYRRIGLDPDAESMGEMAAEFFEGYIPGLAMCSLHDGVLEALELFLRLSVRQFVLSAMEESMLHDMLEALGISERFIAVYGLEHQEGDSKLSRGRDLMNDYGIDPETTLLIGDTDHDADVADALGVSVVLIAQGYQSEERLHGMGFPVYRSVRDWLGVLRIGDADRTDP